MRHPPFLEAESRCRSSLHGWRPAIADVMFLRRDHCALFRYRRSGAICEKISLTRCALTSRVLVRERAIITPRAFLNARRHRSSVTLSRRANDDSSRSDTDDYKRSTAAQRTHVTMVTAAAASLRTGSVTSRVFQVVACRPASLSRRAVHFLRRFSPHYCPLVRPSDCQQRASPRSDIALPPVSDRPSSSSSLLGPDHALVGAPQTVTALGPPMPRIPLRNAVTFSGTPLPLSAFRRSDLNVVARLVRRWTSSSVFCLSEAPATTSPGAAPRR